MRSIEGERRTRKKKPESAVSILVGGGGKKGAAGVEWVGGAPNWVTRTVSRTSDATEKTGKCIF